MKQITNYINENNDKKVFVVWHETDNKSDKIIEVLKVFTNKTLAEQFIDDFTEFGNVDKKPYISESVLWTKLPENL